MTGHIGIARIGAYTRAPSMRLRNPATGKFMHQDCKGETSDETFAWSGSPKQARTLRDRAEAWPYKRVPIEQPETPSW